MKRLLIALLVALVLALPAYAEPQEGVTLDVPAWTPAPANPPVFGAPEVIFRDPGVVAAERPSPDTDPWGETAQALAKLLAEEVRAAGGSIEDIGDDLVVTGPEAAVDLARRRVAAIDRFLTGRSRLAIQFVSLPTTASFATLSATEITARVKAGTARLDWTGRFDLRRGEGGLGESLSERSFLASHSTEVAQHAAITQITPATLRTGGRVYVSCRPLSSRSAMLTLSLHLSHAAEEMREVQTATGILDLPEVDFLSLTTSLHVQTDSPAVLLVDHPFDEGVLAVVVSLLEVPPSDDLPFALVDLAALAGHPDVIDAVESLGAGILPDAGPVHHGYHPNYAPMASGLREPVLASMFEALDESDAGVVALSPVVVAITGSEAARTRARGALARFEGSGRIAREAFRLPWSELATSEFFDPLTGTVAADELRRATEGDAGPARTGMLAVEMAGQTPLLLQHGTWRRYLETMQVQIAEGAAQVRPEVGTYVEGEFLVVVPGITAGWSRPRLTRSSSALLGHETRNLEVRRDIQGERSDEWGQKLDVLHTADTHTEFLVEGPLVTDLHRTGDAAVLHIWMR